MLNGKKVVKLDESNTTRRCSNCGHIKSEGLDPSIRIYTCDACNISIPRDVNSTFNIKHKYLKCSVNEPSKAILDLDSLRCVH